jgi:hypothetical protein
MKKKALIFFHSFWSIILVFFVYSGLGEFKILPMLAVCLMCFGIIYSAFFSLKKLKQKKDELN